MTKNRIPDFPQIDSELKGKVSDFNLIQHLSDENSSLRQVIDKMVNEMATQKELIQLLRDEIATLKGQKPRPKIPPSKLEGPGSKLEWRNQIRPQSNAKITISFSLWVNNLTTFNNTHSLSDFSIALASGSILQERASEISSLAGSVIKKIRRVGKPGQPTGTPRRKKKTGLQIHENLIIQPQNIPEGARFKGFTRYTIQELILKPHNIQYRLARWQVPNGGYIAGELPKEVHGHYGPQLIAYILHQYHACRVTEHLLLDQLRTFGIWMSAGQLNNILIENKDAFIGEVAELLPVAVEVEGQIQVDDTGGRHKGRNQYTTVIGNRWFTVFTTTDSKSRINFLKLLQGGKEEYVLNEDTMEYLSLINVPQYFPGYVSLSLGKRFISNMEWEQFLKERNITKEAEMRFLTEAALYAAVIQNGIPKGLGVHSDDAGQFAAFVHSLCWLHEERHYRKLIMTSDEARAELERVRGQIWILYNGLKKYKESPSKEAKECLDKEFDHVFQQETCSPTLTRQLEKTYAKKQELLRVLERPETSLHNNDSETSARSAKIKLKISGGTRSELGQKVRDAFLSLKQTCLKLGINFFTFLQDRVCRQYTIPRLATIIHDRALGATAPPILSNFQEIIIQFDHSLLAG